MNKNNIQLTIGKFAIWVLDTNRVWIEDTTTGEGGSFKIKDLVDLVEKYFKKNF